MNDIFEHIHMFVGHFNSKEGNCFVLLWINMFSGTVCLIALITLKDWGEVTVESESLEETCAPPVLGV